MDNDELRELLAKATPGEWTLHKHSATTVQAGDGYSATNTDSNFFDANARNEANAALIAAAVNALPRLLADSDELARLRAEIAELATQCRHNAQGCTRHEAHAAGTWRSCARDLDALLRLPAGDGRE